MTSKKQTPSKRINLFVSQSLDGHLAAQASNRGLSKNAYIRLVLMTHARKLLANRKAQQAKANTISTEQTNTTGN